MIIKRLNKKELERFTNKFEIKCNKVIIELVEGIYFITIDYNKPFYIDYELIKQFVSKKYCNLISI